MRNFPLTVLKILLILFEEFPKTLATLATFQSLTNNKNFNYNGSSRLTGKTHFNYNSNYESTSFPLTSTMAENQYTPIQQTEAEITFHDTIQRRSRPLSPSTSVTSQIEPTNILPTTAAMTSITIGGITIEVESTEQVRTTTGALYTKQIRATYDNDKKGKLDLLKLIQSKQQQPYVATSISVNDPEKLLNHYSLSKLNRIPVMAPILAPILGVHFLGEHISLKNGTFCPLFSHDSSSFKDACFLIRLKVLPYPLYGPHLHCRSHRPTS
jgi:hypothetical protein